MPAAVVLFAAIRYTDADGKACDADQGTEVELSGAEYDRLKEMGAVGPPKQRAARRSSSRSRSRKTSASGSAASASAEPEVEPEDEAES